MRKITYRVGEWQNCLYLVTVKVVPGWEDPERFMIALHYNDPETLEVVQVVRIENMALDYVHMDKLHLDVEDHHKAVEMDIWDAWNEIQQNWKSYARKHDRNS
ncbi:MAG: DUF7718 family protein [Candidatus Halalkalibacterium sp. M3_1C_030]